MLRRLIAVTLCIATIVSVPPATADVTQSGAPGHNASLANWYAAKAQLTERHGLTLGFAYTALYQRASDSALQPLESRAAGRPVFGRKEAAGGDFEILGHLDLWDREGRHDATLMFKAEARHRFGTAVAPQNLSREIGSVWPTGTGYREFDPSVVELWLKQRLGGESIEAHVGKIFPLTQYDFSPLDNFRTDFVDAPESFHPSIALPNYGLGANVTMRPRRDLYLRAGIADANGAPERSGIETFFETREYFSVLEAGFDPGALDRAAGGPYADYHLTLWHADQRERAGRPEGWGMIASALRRIGRFTPFVRYGYSEGKRGGPALLEHMAAGGAAIDGILGRPADRIGVGLAWGRPANGLLDDQGSGEVFYRVQVTRELALTYSAQLIVNPARNPDQDVILVSGVRGRVKF